MEEKSVSSSEEHHPVAVNSDPTQLTTDIIRREIAHLSGRVDLKIEGVVTGLVARIDAIDKATAVFSESLFRVPTETQRAISSEHAVTAEKFAIVQTRFEGADRALKLLQEIADRFPLRIDEKIGSLKEVHDGQFTAIQQQFIERDVRTDKMSEASAIAIGAALQAAKEAVAEQNRSSALAIAKSEAATDKRIDQIGALVQTATGALDGKITDIKDRLIIMEGRGIGQTTQKAEAHSNSGMTIAVISIGVSILLALFAVFAFIQKIPAAP